MSKARALLRIHCIQIVHASSSLACLPLQNSFLGMSVPKTKVLFPAVSPETLVISAGREPPLGRDALTSWFQDDLCWVLADAPPPELPRQPGPNQWTPALRGLLRKTPILPLEPADPQPLVGRTFWKLFWDDQQWWRGRVIGHVQNSEEGDWGPHYKVRGCFW